MSRKSTFRFIVILICLYLIVTTVQAIFDLWRAGDKLVSREARVAALKKDQELLEQRKAVVEKPSYWEKVARDQLGLSLPGEKIIVVPRELLVDQAQQASQEAVPNWRKWAQLFF